MKQRIRVRSSPLAIVGRLLLVLLSGALVWYGLMLVLLALKASPVTIDEISGHRTAYDYLAGLGTSDVPDDIRLIVAICGVVAFLFFAFLALKEIPRPYLARSDVAVDQDEGGGVLVEARAIERVAELAAAENPSVTAVAGRYGGDDITVDVHVGRARDLAEILRDVQRRVAQALDRHELPGVKVSVILTGFEPQHRRELH